MTRGMSFIGAPIVVALLALLSEAPAHANARISALVDVNFGTINSPADQSISQNVCAYSAQGFANPLDYSVQATGSGGGAFLLSSGARTLPYEVRWADSPDQTGGTQLLAGVPATGFGNGALFQACGFQPNGSASLTVTIRATAVAAATAGNYSGVLQITIIPE